MITHESEEMYLETILILSSRNEKVRSVDIVEELDYAKSSVSRAVNLLKTKGYIEIDGNGDISFTPEGRKRAEETYEKHRVFTEMFVRFGADRTLAEENACRVEHVISEDLFKVIKEYFSEHFNSE